jgi:hypothetical protein
MKTWLKVLLITLVVAAPAFVLGPIIWPPDPHTPAPAGLQLVLLMVLAALESLAFGLGMAFISYGLPLVRRLASPSRAHAWMAFSATAWLLISWWPHDNMHIHNGGDLAGMLVIEYLFHVSLMVAGALLAYTVVQALQTVTATGRAPDQRRASAATGD